jgi:hypothetical protein
MVDGAVCREPVSGSRQMHSDVLVLIKDQKASAHLLGFAPVVAPMGWLQIPEECGQDASKRQGLGKWVA